MSVLDQIKRELIEDFYVQVKNLTTMLDNEQCELAAKTLAQSLLGVSKDQLEKYVQALDSTQQLMESGKLKSRQMFAMLATFVGIK